MNELTDPQAMLLVIKSKTPEEVADMAESTALEDFQAYSLCAGNQALLPEDFYTPVKVALRSTSEYINKLNQIIVGTAMPSLGVKMVKASMGDDFNEANGWIKAFSLLMTTLSKNKTPAVMQQFNFPQQGGINLESFKVKE